MRKTAGVLTALAGIALGLYLALWVFLVGGIEDIANGFKATPTDGWSIVWGFVELPLAVITGILTFVILVTLGVRIYHGKPWFQKAGSRRSKGL